MREVEDREPYASEPRRGMNRCNPCRLSILTRHVIVVLHQQTGSIVTVFRRAYYHFPNALTNNIRPLGAKMADFQVADHVETLGFRTDTLA